MVCDTQVGCGAARQHIRSAYAVPFAVEKRVAVKRFTFSLISFWLVQF